MTPFLFLILVICVISFFLASPTRSFPTLFIFWKNHLLVLLIFSTDFCSSLLWQPLRYYVPFHSCSSPIHLPSCNSSRFPTGQRTVFHLLQTLQWYFLPSRWSPSLLLLPLHRCKIWSAHSSRLTMFHPRTSWNFGSIEKTDIQSLHRYEFQL